MSNCTLCKRKVFGGQDNIFMLNNHTICICDDCIKKFAIEKCDVCMKPIVKEHHPLFEKGVEIDHEYYCKTCY